MKTVTEVRQAICTILEGAGLTAYPHPVGLGTLPPFAWVSRTEGIARTDFGVTSPGYELTITVIVTRTDNASAYALLDKYVSRGTAESIFDLLDADKTLGGTCHTFQGIMAGGDVEFNAEDTASYLGVVFTLLCYPL